MEKCENDAVLLSIIGGFSPYRPPERHVISLSRQRAVFGSQTGRPVEIKGLFTRNLRCWPLKNYIVCLRS